MEKSTLRSISTRAGFNPRLSQHGSSGKIRGLATRPKTDDGYNHGYPRLSDPEDVAARIAESWNEEFAAQGGTRYDFAASARARLRHWAAARDGEGISMTFEMRFRSEVARKVSARLETWARQDASARPEAGARQEAGTKPEVRILPARRKPRVRGP